MLFVALMRAKPGTTARQRVARRLDWTYPAGVTVVGEYWLTTGDPKVVAVVEASDIGLAFQIISEWDDVFDISVYPAETAEAGIDRARERFAAAVV